MRCFIITICFLISSISFGQSIVVSGYVLDEDSNPITDVEVVSSTNKVIVQTKTNQQGMFQISLNDSIHQLTFTKSGYKPFSTSVSSNSTLTVYLEYSDLLSMSIEEILKTNVNTVSLNAEKITDAPGVVTVFTSAELKNMGIRTVREALTFVPGFSTMQNDDEQILAMRGIFATSNQKILFLRNGHSLNEANLDIPFMEYNISIENIKKIEIIRGPGASIYGNSAFAAVVNIITQDKESTLLKTTIGNHGLFGLDGQISKKLSETSSFLGFFRYTNIQGEKSNPSINDPNTYLTESNYTLNNYPRNYDAGFVYTSEHINTSISFQKHHYQTYWSVDGYYTNTDSIIRHPGLMHKSIHFDLDLKYELQRNVSLKLQHYANISTLTNSRLLNNLDETTYLHGRLQVNEWNVLKSGVNYFSTWNYLPSGNLIAGIAFEYRQYMDSWVMSNTMDSSRLTMHQSPFFPTGHENRGAVYLQGNHTFTPWFKVNTGVRFDLAEKYKTTFNPRVALIFYPANDINVKIIYTKAFQAPGYSYRVSNAEYSGSIEALQPEIINTFQSSIRYDISSSVFCEVSAFYNRVNNLITRIDANYSNYGKLASYGFEGEFHADLEKARLFINYALLLPDTTYIDDRFNTANITDNRFKNMPMHRSNFGTTLKLHKNFNWTICGQYSGAFYNTLNENTQPTILFNSTINICNILDKFIISASCYNLFNTKYALGDPSVLPMNQSGRWISLSLSLSF